MTFKKGQSGNPSGRPPKDRAIASQIEKALNKAEVGSDGKKHRRAKLIADIWVGALLTGVVTLPNGTTMMLPPREWLEMGKFVFTHIDGQVKSQVELSGDADAPVVLKVVYTDKA